MKKINKFLSYLVALCMVLSLLPATALAADPTEAQEIPSDYESMWEETRWNYGDGSSMLDQSFLGFANNSSAVMTADEDAGETEAVNGIC